MTLHYLLRAALSQPERPVRALVLMGGGARTAYQAGVLRALASMLGPQASPDRPFPFQLLVGTSAGALNTAFLAGCATQGLAAFEQLAAFWGELRSHSIYALNLSRWSRLSRLATALQLWRHTRQEGAVLDTMPLSDTLHRRISLVGVEEALESGALEALAVTASSYTTGVHWTFCQKAPGAASRPWQGPGRRGEFEPITFGHLLASAAIPFLFPSVPLWVDSRPEYFGDGSMRQISPLSPALRLGATKVMVIGVGQPQRSGLAAGGAERVPGFGSIAGHALASVFHDTMHADVEQAVRVTRALEQMPPEVAAAMPYRPVDVFAMQPSRSLDALAQENMWAMPRDLRRVLGGLGAQAATAPLASYLLFEPSFLQALMQLGEQDAWSKRAELMAFFEPAEALARA